MTCPIRMWIFCVVATALFGCPGGSGGGDGGTAMVAERAWDPIMCSSMSSLGDCSTAHLQEWADCELANCQSKLDACYGPQFRSGIYQGACAAFMECARSCSCYDAECVAACSLNDECATCLEATPCEAPGACELMCDVVPTADKTCEDVMRCCPGLPDALRADCMSEAANNQGTADGELNCSGIYPFYALASSSCD